MELPDRSTPSASRVITFTEEELGPLLFATLSGNRRAEVVEFMRRVVAASAVGQNWAGAPARPESGPGSPSVSSISVIAPDSGKSVDIGASGEKMVREILQREYSVETVSGKAYSGDIMIFRPRKYGQGSVNIMIEVKNYRNMVPSTEVEKFQRDASVMPNIHAAMMISLGSPIAGHSSMDITDLTHGRSIPLLYLSSDSPEVILAAAKLLHLHVDQHRSIRSYLEHYNEHMYPKIWKNATKAMDLLQGIAQTRILILELRTQTCQKIDKIQERILVNETQLTRTVEKIRHLVSEFVPESLSGGLQVKAADLWDCIGRVVTDHADGSAYHRCVANSAMVRARLEMLIKLPTGNLNVQLHGRTLMVSQTSPVFRLKLLVDSTEIGFLPAKEEEIRLSAMQTYDGSWICERIGRKGNILQPRPPTLRPPTVHAEWKPGDLVEDMLTDLMPED